MKSSAPLLVVFSSVLTSPSSPTDIEALFVCVYTGVDDREDLKAG
jgi:hypothetical protein